MRRKKNNDLVDIFEEKAEDVFTKTETVTFRDFLEEAIGNDYERVYRDFEKGGDDV